MARATATTSLTNFPTCSPVRLWSVAAVPSPSSCYSPILLPRWLTQRSIKIPMVEKATYFPTTFGTIGSSPFQHIPVVLIDGFMSSILKKEFICHNIWKSRKYLIRTRLTMEFVYFQRFDEICLHDSISIFSVNQIKSLFIFSVLTRFLIFVFPINSISNFSVISKVCLFSEFWRVYFMLSSVIYTWYERFLREKKFGKI